MAEVEVPIPDTDKETEKKFQAKFAIVRRVASSLSEQAQRMDESGAKPDLALAREHHKKYIDNLRNMGLDVHEFDSDEKYPDCCFVEDVAVCVDGIALINHIGHPSRQGEVC